MFFPKVWPENLHFDTLPIENNMTAVDYPIRFEKEGERIWVDWKSIFADSATELGHVVEDVVFDVVVRHRVVVDEIVCDCRWLTTVAKAVASRRGDLETVGTWPPESKVIKLALKFRLNSYTLIVDFYLLAAAI